MNATRINRIWLAAFELAARRPWLGTTVGLALVAVLIPILTVAGGYTGALGPSIPLFFLVPMLLASTLGGRIAGAIVSVAAVFCWDWFFIPPLHTVTIYYPRDLLALVIFLLDALLTGQLATVARRRAEEAIQRARTSEAHYDLSVALIGSHDLARVLPVLTERLRQTFDLAACAILLHPPDRTSWQSGALAGTLPDDLDIERSRNVAGILSWVSSTGQTCTLGSTDRRLEGGSSERRAEFWPLRVGERVVGVLELVFKRGTRMDAQRDRLLATLVNGAAIALEQDRLFHEEQAAAVARESDRLKSALLSSVSHDLRTPLAGIKAAATSLLQTDVQWSEEDRRAFLTDIDSEADRLTRLVSNLLDLSRIEAGAIKPSREWEDVGELVAHVVHRFQTHAPGRHILIDVAPGLPPVRVDAVHVEQALTNLIENAARYSPAGAPIEVSVGLAPADATAISIAVTDQGIGIAREEQSRIFDKFYRVAASGRRTYGTGMGLAIVKGLIEANGGRVTVESDPGRGSTFRIVLPAAERAEPPQAPSQATQSSASGPPDR